MKWAKFKSYASKLGAKTHKVSRPELTTAVLEIEERELAKPVEEAIPAPPLEPVGVSVATMTAVPWNDPDAVPSANQGGTHSDPMQRAMLELIADRKKRGLM